MLSRCVRHTLALVSITGLAACVQQPGPFDLNGPYNLESGFQTTQTFQEPNGQTGLIERDLSSGLMSTRLANNGGRAPLGSFTDAHLVQTFTINGEQGALIQGSSPGCRVKYVIVTANTATTSWSAPIGTCNNEFEFRQQPQGVFLVEKGVRDPQVFGYNQRVLNGPVMLSTIKALNKAKEANNAPRPRQHVFDAQNTHRPQPAPVFVSKSSLPAPQEVSTPSTQSALASPQATPRAPERVGDDQLPPRATEHTAPSSGWVPQFDPE